VRLCILSVVHNAKQHPFLIHAGNVNTVYDFFFLFLGSASRHSLRFDGDLQPTASGDRQLDLVRLAFSNYVAQQLLPDETVL